MLGSGLVLCPYFLIHHIFSLINLTHFMILNTICRVMTLKLTSPQTLPLNYRLI